MAYSSFKIISHGLSPHTAEEGPSPCSHSQLYELEELKIIHFHLRHYFYTSQHIYLLKQRKREKERVIVTSIFISHSETSTELAKHSFQIFFKLVSDRQTD